MHSMFENIVKKTFAPSRVELNLYEGIKSLQECLRTRSSQPVFIDVNHEKLSNWTTLIHLAKSNDDAYELLTGLAQYGYIVYKSGLNGTQLIHRDSVSKVWPALRNGEYEQDPTGIVYKFTGPRAGGTAKSLVVVFSSVHKNMYTQKLDRHFAMGFRNLEKSISGQTAVLRIADLDGVVGGFYLPTARDPYANIKLGQLIQRMASSLGIPSSKIVAIGASKGGTGALYTALSISLNCIAIDPIITNKRREDRENDPYFASSSIFTSTRDERFKQAFREFDLREFEGKGPQISVLTSKCSDEYDDITGLFDDTSNNSLRLIETLNPRIRSHQDVAHKSAAFVYSLINLYTNNLHVEFERHSIID